MKTRTEGNAAWSLVAQVAMIMCVVGVAQTPALLPDRSIFKGVLLPQSSTSRVRLLILLEMRFWQLLSRWEILLVNYPGCHYHRRIRPLVFFGPYSSTIFTNAIKYPLEFCSISWPRHEWCTRINSKPVDVGIQISRYRYMVVFQGPLRWNLA